MVSTCDVTILCSFQKLPLVLSGNPQRSFQVYQWYNPVPQPCLHSYVFISIITAHKENPKVSKPYKKWCWAPCQEEEGESPSSLCLKLSSDARSSSLSHHKVPSILPSASSPFSIVDLCLIQRNGEKDAILSSVLLQ